MWLTKFLLISHVFELKLQETETDANVNSKGSVKLQWSARYTFEIAPTLAYVLLEKQYHFSFHF